VRRALRPAIESMEGRPLPSTPHPLTASGLVHLVVCDGNSLTFGASLSIPGTATPANYPAQLQSDLGPSWEVINHGIPGQTIEQMIASEQTTFAALPFPRWAFHRPNDKPIDIVWEGTNSIALNHDSGEEASELLARYVAERHARGFKVIVLTCLPADNPTLWPEFEAQREIYNALIRANRVGADAVVDVASDPRLSDPDSPYFGPDHVHLDDAGYGVVASLVATALEHPSLPALRTPTRLR